MAFAVAVEMLNLRLRKQRQPMKLRKDLEQGRREARRRKS